MPSSYISVNGRAKKIKKIYCSVNGVAREVKKAFYGVSGYAKQCYSVKFTENEEFTFAKFPFADFANTLDNAIYKPRESNIAKSFNKKYISAEIGSLSEMHRFGASLSFNGYAMFAGGSKSASSWSSSYYSSCIDAYDNSLTESKVYLSKPRAYHKGAVISNKYAVFATGFTSSDRLDSTIDMFNVDLVRTTRSGNYVLLFEDSGATNFLNYAVFGGGIFQNENEDITYFTENLTLSNSYFSHEGGPCVAASNGKYVIFNFQNSKANNEFNSNFVCSHITSIPFVSGVSSSDYVYSSVSTDDLASFLSSGNNGRCQIFGFDKNLVRREGKILEFADSGSYISKMNYFNNKLIITNNNSDKVKIVNSDLS